MAGREFSGFEYSLDNLFDEASFIITPTDSVPQAKLNLLEDFAYSMHFKKVVFASPEEHDQIIAFTSQLAHVVSNAYIKSPTHRKQLGFSAGSFQDLTRVAKLNEVMWTPLFMLNKEPLCFDRLHYRPPYGVPRRHAKRRQRPSLRASERGTDTQRRD